MAGHSQFKNIMYRKGAQDAKRAKMFAKIAREIIVSVKSGGAEASSNPRLRAALASARAANMPRDNVERAIKKASGGEDLSNYEEVRYEGYGIAGVAVIVETLTDNRNRTASEVRSTFSKNGGNLGETGSVGFCFERLGVLHFAVSKFNFDQVFEAAVNAGADNVETLDDLYEVTCPMESFAAVRDSLIETLGDPHEAKIIWKPLTTVAANEEQAKTLFKMIDTLEDNDDIQNVYTNVEISDEVLKKLS
ncbi:MAG: YebC/PmpR family DNA-binding transcriptional regulator [Pseudomonadota bacterium]|jgi:YebC/PmpR family DNA-binding regulatory protein|nr:YebC/PmpR family DNA-binding transcriptional regulator [Alphaproteobacteria bacterium]